MADDIRCSVCNRPIYFRGVTDEVGRAKSGGSWVHWDQAQNEDHNAKPK